MIAKFQTGNLTEWTDGQPIPVIYNTNANSSNLTTWGDGQPFQQMFPINDYGNFFLFINM